jgi:hypothetical protein
METSLDSSRSLCALQFKPACAEAQPSMLQLARMVFSFVEPLHWHLSERQNELFRSRHRFEIFLDLASRAGTAVPCQLDPPLTCLCSLFVLRCVKAGRAAYEQCEILRRTIWRIWGKSAYCSEVFYAWANVITPTAQKSGGRIAYIDLYAGPGRYKDGAASTPLLVLQHAITDPRLMSMLVTLLKDSDGNKTSVLQTEIDNLPGIEKLKYKPMISCGEIDEEAEKYGAGLDSKERLSRSDG